MKPYNDQSPVLVKRSYCKLITINALVCGMETIYACAFTYIPPLLLKSGYSETVMTIILGIAPFIDLVVVPILAERSDKCTSSFGRRRPFIVILSSFLLFSLILIPFSSEISKVIIGTSSGKFNMFVLAIGVIILDSSYQALFNPCESLLSDLMTVSEEKSSTLGFTIYSACLSLGCIIGYLVVFIRWHSFISVYNLNQSQVCFLVTTMFFIITILLTLSTKEETYYEFVNCDEVDTSTIYEFESDHKILLSNDQNCSTSMCENSEEVFNKVYNKQYLKNLLRRFQSMTLADMAAFVWKLISLVMFIPYKLMSLPIGCYKRVMDAAYVVRCLFFVELFGWIAVLGHNVFFPDFVGQYMFHGDPTAPDNTTVALLYNEGVRIGSWGLFLQSSLACTYAFFIQEKLVLKLGPRKVFLSGLLILAISLILTPLSPSIHFLSIVTGFTGIGFAVLTTTPNMLVTLYFQNKKTYMQDLIFDVESDECKGIGSYFSILDMAFYLSQILNSLIIGPMVDLTGTALPYVQIPAIASIITFYFGTRVIFNETQIKELRRRKFMK